MTHTHRDNDPACHSDLFPCIDESLSLADRGRFTLHGIAAAVQASQRKGSDADGAPGERAPHGRRKKMEGSLATEMVAD